jgi:hypothetical protein
LLFVVGLIDVEAVGELLIAIVVIVDGSRMVERLGWLDNRVVRSVDVGVEVRRVLVGVLKRWI